jgi:hypothetical protein
MRLDGPLSVDLGVLFAELDWGSQKPSETEFVTVGVNQVEEALTPFGVAGRSSWLAPRCERTVVKFIDIGDVEDYAPPPGPAALGRLGDEVKIARPCSKAGE